MINYWWVTRPKRKLNSVPSTLAVFAEEALNEVWNKQRASHISLEEALEKQHLKRTGTRRDHTGGGGRTYAAWLRSLGLLFNQTETKQIKLTLAGEAIMAGESPVKIIRNQILKYQFPSTFSIGRGVKVNPRFHIHPFWFLFRLLMDDRIEYLTEEELAKIVITEADKETDKCYEYIVSRILQFRDYGDACLDPEFNQKYGTSKQNSRRADPFAHLTDTANTIMNWMEYTQYISREKQKMYVLDEAKSEVQKILNHPLPFIKRPEDEEYFQRRYGLDLNHSKDTRNLLDTQTVTPYIIAEHLVRQEFISLSLTQLISGITPEITNTIAENTGLDPNLVADTLQKFFPHGSIGSYMANYFEMAFRGREECRDFEIATSQIFNDVFKFNAKHIAGGAKEVPDVLLVSDSAGYQAIIDTKAYSRYDLGAQQRDRMIYHYLPEIHNYSDSGYPLAFFSYIAGGFSRTIEQPLQKIVKASGINGSAMPVSNFIKLAEIHSSTPFSHEELRRIFSLNRKVDLSDIMK